ncbi:hypothetical protein ACHHYP_14070 [Achlya hypogyna]|uniref:Transmembrane protein n=1 Tax=Achlya hypogyna TaxID=1202772 RepID=A0A1V9YE33_ACHHY|nr:hypothetical protein ACHHYP_14070 [Achlya hypogyna]
MAHDWVMGKREIVAFEGDVSSLVVISNEYPPLHYGTPADELKQATKAFYYLCAYTSAVLVFVSGLCTVYGTASRFRIVGRNLWRFNRVAASVWIGRPLLLVRGGTALLLLSTANVRLVRTNNITQLTPTPWSVLETAVIAGEATWLAYIISDLLLLFSAPLAHIAAPLGAFGTWFAYVLLQHVAPVQLSVSLDRTCASTDMDYYIMCTSGVVEVGSTSRLALLLCLLGALVVVSYGVAWLMRHQWTARAFTPPLLISSSTAIFFTASKMPWTIDSVACVMAGLLPFGFRGARFVFDLKSWRVVLDSVSSEVAYLATAPLLTSRSPTSGPMRGQLRRRRVAAIGGLLYMGCTMAGSVSYLGISHVNLANDLWWASFNTSGAHIFLANWLNEQLYLNKRADVMLLDEPALALAEKTLAAAFVSSPTNFGATLQRTQLSNLRDTIAGQIWLRDTVVTTAFSKTVTDEAAMWRRWGIDRYVVQWQNYKQVGLRNVYTVESAFGTSASLTLQALNGSYMYDVQTSFKAYWAFANDLAAVQSNSSGIGEHSLVRSSPRFAFANTTLESVLVQTGYLRMPLIAGFVLVQDHIGPFGAIDQVFIAPPVVAQEAMRNVIDSLRKSAMESSTSRTDYANLPVPNSMYPVPSRWMQHGLLSYGGSVLCGDLVHASGAFQTSGMASSFTFASACPTVTTQSKITPTREQFLTALVFANVSSGADVASLCDLETESPATCPQLLSGAISFLSTHVACNWSTSAAADAITALQVSFMQLTRTSATAPLVWSVLPLLDATDKPFYFFAWCYLVDWLQGFREVVAFEGDTGRVALISDPLLPLQQGVSSWELPMTMATYARAGVQYVTFVILAVSGLVGMYILGAKGHIEGWNMLELNRVGAIVWIGRPLLVLRALTALAVLCTGSLELVASGPMLSLRATSVPWYKTCLAASEVSWLVAIIHDMVVVVTKETTQQYATPSDVLITATSAVWSLVSPVGHSASVGLDCTIADVDFQVVCTGATVVIGSLTRVLQLLMVVFGLNVAVYCIVRALMKRPTSSPTDSLLLYAGAKFLFSRDGWILNGVYHLDRASAALSGLVSLRLQQKLFVLDIKTWRTHILDDPGARNTPTDLATSMRFALPLPNASTGAALAKSPVKHPSAVNTK